MVEKNKTTFNDSKITSVTEKINAPISSGITVALDDLLLDPNNFRFIDNSEYEFVEEKDILNETIQKRTYGFLIQDGVTDLIESYKKNSFLPVDMIQVRTVRNSNKYIVVEGNRRVAALKLLQSNERKHLDIGSFERQIFDNVPVVFYFGADERHHLVLMGLKHISGNKKWPAINQAKLVGKFYYEYGLSTKEIKSTLGVSSDREVSTILQTLALIDQYQHSDYSVQFESEKYSIFREIIRSRPIREWLDWDSSKYIANNRYNLERLFSWISKEEADQEEDEDSISYLEPVILRSAQIRDLSKIINDEQALANLDITRNLTNATLSSDILGKDKVKNAISIISQEITAIFNVARFVENSDRHEIQGLSEKLKSIVNINSLQSVTSSSRRRFLRTSHGVILSDVNVINYKHLHNIKISSLKRINVIAGGNNSGKTTLLECICQLASLSSTDEYIKLAKRRAKIKSDNVDVEWFYQQFGDIELSANADSVSISVNKIDMNLESDVTNYVGSLGFDVRVGSDEYKSDTHFFNKYPHKTEGVPVSLCPIVYTSPYIWPEDSVLMSCYNDSIKNGTKSSVIEFIKNNFDETITGIELGDQKRFIVTHLDSSKNKDLSNYGEGLQRVFQIGVLCCGAQNGIFAIDELESAIHTSLLGKIANLIYDLSVKLNAQIFISSHSKECIDAFVTSGVIPASEITAFSLIDADTGKSAFMFSGDELKTLNKNINFDLRGKGKK
ncbi:TPA: ATP-binding protein [Aeromonas dhakensis]|nr:ATP-binding protein [Aeromonas dhakensis]